MIRMRLDALMLPIDVTISANTTGQRQPSSFQPALPGSAARRPRTVTPISQPSPA